MDCPDYTNVIRPTRARFRGSIGHCDSAVQGGTGQHGTVRNGQLTVTKFTAEVAVLDSGTRALIGRVAGVRGHV